MHLFLAFKHWKHAQNKSWSKYTCLQCSSLICKYQFYTKRGSICTYLPSTYNNQMDLMQLKLWSYHVCIYSNGNYIGTYSLLNVKYKREWMEVSLQRFTTAHVITVPWLWHSFRCWNGPLHYEQATWLQSLIFNGFIVLIICFSSSFR